MKYDQYQVSAFSPRPFGGNPAAVVPLQEWLSGELVVTRAGDDIQDEAAVRSLQPDMAALLRASDRPVIVAAPGDSVDFVSRFFGPQVGIEEDPVTGSAHCALVPLWAQKLDKSQLGAWQVSERLGELHCELRGDGVFMAGRALAFLRGRISLPQA